MDGREARELWDAFKGYLERAVAPFQRLMMNLLGKGTKGTIKVGGRFLRKRMEAIGDHSGLVALQRVKNDGPNKDTYILGEFDRKEAEEIVKMAQDENVKIAIVEKFRDEDSNVFESALSETATQNMIEYEQEIEHQRQLINKYSMQNMKEEKKNKKIKKCKETIESLQIQIKKIQDYYPNKSYMIMVNASQKQFIQKVKDDFLDKDTKDTIEKLKNERFNRIHFEDVLKDFKDVEQAYNQAKAKEEELYKKKEEKQYMYDKLLKKREVGNLTTEETNDLNHQIKVASDELTSIKNDWVDQLKIRDLAKETYEKKTFTGDFTKENIRKSKGNLSSSMDKYDITHFPEGYATFKMTSDEYYNMVSNNQNQLFDMPYGAFKQTEHSDVEFLCSSRDVAKVSDMIQTYIKSDVVVDIHQTNGNIDLDEAKNVGSWNLPLKDNQNLQNDINLITDFHQKNNGLFMMDIQYSKEGKPTINVHSSLDFKEFQKFEENAYQKHQKQATKERDQHLRDIQSGKVYDFTNRSKDVVSYTKEQERQLTISNSFFMDKNSKYYDPKKQQFLENNSLSSEEMQSYTNGFVQGLSTKDAETILNEDIEPSALNDIINDFLDRGQER